MLIPARKHFIGTFCPHFDDQFRELELRNDVKYLAERAGIVVFVIYGRDSIHTVSDATF